jgi:hypothetical protein
VTNAELPSTEIESLACSVLLPAPNLRARLAPVCPDILLRVIYLSTCYEILKYEGWRFLSEPSETKQTPYGSGNYDGCFSLFFCATKKGKDGANKEGRGEERGNSIAERRGKECAPYVPPFPTFLLVHASGNTFPKAEMTQIYLTKSRASENSLSPYLLSYSCLSIVLLFASTGQWVSRAAKRWCRHICGLFVPVCILG